MKIAVWHNLPSGGGKRALYNHIKGLQEKGHYVESWTTDLAAQDYLPLSEIVTEHCKPLKNKFLEINKRKNSIRRILGTIKLLKIHYQECVEEIQQGGFDLIFANSCRITYLPYISSFAKIPVLVYLGEPNRSLYEASEYSNTWQLPDFRFSLRGMNRLRKDIFRSYANRILLSEEVAAAKKFTKILVNSLYSRESIIRAYGVDASVCYLGIEVDKFNAEETVKEGYVVGLGSITRNKGVHKAIEVISKIPPEVRPELKWIGNDQDNYYLEELNTMALNLKVVFRPYHHIDDNELVRIVSRASVMIYTSRLEPFGLAPLECNACGTYVTAIAEGGVRESICDGVNGTLVYGYKPLEMAEIIKELIVSADLARHKGESAREFVRQKWGNAQLTSNICNEIESVVH